LHIFKPFQGKRDKGKLFLVTDLKSKCRQLESLLGFFLERKIPFKILESLAKKQETITSIPV
jgi:hypothetical protein